MPANTRVLLLAGSSEASAIARRLPELGYDDVTVSFAGRTTNRVSTPGKVRVGGFGGPDGLASYLTAQRVDALIDATHPFAAHMPWNALQAAATTGVPRLRVQRAPWVVGDGDHWRLVDDLADAAHAVEHMGSSRVFLTTGRQDLEPFARVRNAWFLVRAIEEPASMPLAHARVVLARGPFAEAEEHALMRDNDIDLLVTKNSGGAAAAPKLSAARSLKVPVVMVTRPATPPGPVVTAVDEAFAWLAGLAANAGHPSDG